MTQILAKLRNVAHSVWRFVVGEILAGGPDLRWARRMIERQLRDETEKYAQEVERFKSLASGLEEDDLRRYMTFEADRRKSIDDKAKTNLIGITIGFTVLFASLNFVGKKELNATVLGHSGLLAVGLLAVGVVYLVFGGLKALEALQIAQIYSPSPADESGVSKERRTANLLWCLEQNQKTSLLRTNAVSVSYRSIRNGVLSLAVSLLILAGRMLILLWAQ